MKTELINYLPPVSKIFDPPLHPLPYLEQIGRDVNKDSRLRNKDKDTKLVVKDKRQGRIQESLPL